MTRRHDIEDAARRAPAGFDQPSIPAGNPWSPRARRAAMVDWLLPRLILLAGFVGLWAILTALAPATSAAGGKGDRPSALMGRACRDAAGAQTEGAWPVGEADAREAKP